MTQTLRREEQSVMLAALNREDPPYGTDSGASGANLLGIDIPDYRLRIVSDGLHTGGRRSRAIPLDYRLRIVSFPNTSIASLVLRICHILSGLSDELR